MHRSNVGYLILTLIMDWNLIRGSIATAISIIMFVAARYVRNHQLAQPYPLTH